MNGHVNNNHSTAVVERWREIDASIDSCCRRAGRARKDVQLIAVSKTFGSEVIANMLEQTPQRHFGESRVQEAQGKWPELKADWPDTFLHMIGRLQSNKAGDAVDLFDMIHSIDRPGIVKALAKAMDRKNRIIPCLIQVNLEQEAQKGGCAPDAVANLYTLAQEHKIPIRGLMTIPPINEEPAPYFALLYKMARMMGLPIVSMGMSGDYECAIEQGASHLRIGSALFGDRR